MKLSNKTLGIIAMIGAPFLFLEMSSEHILGWLGKSAPGICDLIYMIGWLCSVIVLKRQDAAGYNKHARRLISLNLIFLSFACVWNVWEAIDPTNTSLLYKILDAFWPACNILLFITGIVIAVKGKLTGFSRYTPLIAGSWLAFAMVFGMLAGRSVISFYAIGLYSVIAWFLLGVTVYNSGNTFSERNTMQPAFA